MRARSCGVVVRLMTPFNAPTNSRYHLVNSSYFLLSRLRAHYISYSYSFSSCSAYSVGQTANTRMEVVKEVLKHASVSHERVAVRADQKSYSFVRLIASALDVYNILCSKNDGTNGSILEAANATRCLSGARVGIVAKPCPEFVAGIFGTWLSGGIAVPLALSYPEAELLHVMNDADVSMILSTEEHREVMESISTKCSSRCALLPPVTSIPLKAGSQELSNAEVTSSISSLMAEIDNSKKTKGDDPALILYTSGTTGKPKGVVHTHRSIISQVQILTEAWEYKSEDQFLHCLPLHHIHNVHGLFNALLAPLYAGSVVEFIPKFSVRTIWQKWRESYPKDGSKVDDAITVFTGVPTMYTRLLQGYDSMDPDQQSACSFAANKLRLMMCGSSALPYPVMKKWEDVTGHRLLERYGMTEFIMALSNPLHGVRKGGTVGKPLPRVEVKIIMEDGTETTTGVGELCVRSPSLFKEYWKRPEVTAESVIDGGFFKTGDTVTVDEDGYFVILGRTNADIMKFGGYKLSALEIEAVILEHEAVSECAVLGLPDKDYGEVVCAIVVPQEDARKKAEQDLQPAMTLEVLKSWSKEKLAPYKIPTRLYLWDSLPRNAMGKVNKKELKKLLGA